MSQEALNTPNLVSERGQRSLVLRVDEEVWMRLHKHTTLVFTETKHDRTGNHVVRGEESFLVQRYDLF